MKITSPVSTVFSRFRSQNVVATSSTYPHTNLVGTSLIFILRRQQALIYAVSENEEEEGDDERRTTSFGNINF